MCYKGVSICRQVVDRSSLVVYINKLWSTYSMRNMKIYIITISIILFSCEGEDKPSTYNKSTINNRTEIIKADSLNKNENERNYLSSIEIKGYLKSSPNVKKKSYYSKPFSGIEFNKVIAYDYDYHRGDREPYFGIIHPLDNEFIDQIFYQKFLSQQQTDSLIEVLTSKQTYGGSKAQCFYPSIAFVFYQDDEIRTVIDVCLDCNSLRSTHEIPSRKVTVLEEFKDGFKIYADGFSEKGEKRIIEISKTLGLEYGDYIRE